MCLRLTDVSDSQVIKQVSALRNRGRDVHESLAFVMLSRGIIGPETMPHPEWQALSSGMSLSCSGGFDAKDVSKKYNHGTLPPIMLLEVDGGFTFRLSSAFLGAQSYS